MNSAIYSGHVRHRRFEPVPHAFTYGLYMMYLDLDELPSLFDGRWFWSGHRPSLAWFRRDDYHGDACTPLADAVRETVEQQLDWRPTGPIRLLTQLRTYGYVFNPVSFYYCFADDGETLQAILAEITNTPWKERHAYALDCRGRHSTFQRFQFRKAFHVSPFMPMSIDYDWRFRHPGDRLTVHMQNEQEDGKCFDATLDLERRPLTGGELARVLTMYPLITFKIVAGIYWQALRLKLKGVPFFEHPRYRDTDASDTRDHVYPATPDTSRANTPSPRHPSPLTAED